YRSASVEVSVPRELEAEAARSIAVLPFANMSGDQNQDYFADGMAEELLDTLAKVPQLTVIGRTSSFSFRGRNADARVIGQKLGVAHIVEGSVRRSGDRIRISAQLIDAQTGARVWSNTYDRSFGDVLTVQDEIASSIARALQITIDAEAAHESRTLRN